MKTIMDWQEEPFKEGVVYYMDDHRVQGSVVMERLGESGGNVR